MELVGCTNDGVKARRTNPSSRPATRLTVDRASGLLSREPATEGVFGEGRGGSMRRSGWAVILSCLCAMANGCNSGQPSAPPAHPVRAEDLIGKWRLVRVDGQPPAAFEFKS